MNLTVLLLALITLASTANGQAATDATPAVTVHVRTTTAPATTTTTTTATPQTTAVTPPTTATTTTATPLTTATPPTTAIPPTTATTTTTTTSITPTTATTTTATTTAATVETTVATTATPPPTTATTTTAATTTATTAVTTTTKPTTTATTAATTTTPTTTTTTTAPKVTPAPYYVLTADQLKAVAAGQIAVRNGTCSSTANSVLCCTNGTVGHGIEYNLKLDIHSHIECCGTSTKCFSPSSHYCCNNLAHMRSVTGEMDCCKTCPTQVPYNREKQLECGKKLHDLPVNHKLHPLACCNGNETYVTTQKICCDGVLHNQNMATGCCGKNPIASGFKCCRDPTNKLVSNYYRAYSSATSYCCMGEGVTMISRVKSGQVKCIKI